MSERKELTLDEQLTSSTEQGGFKNVFTDDPVAEKPGWSEEYGPILTDSDEQIVEILKSFREEMGAVIEQSTEKERNVIEEYKKRKEYAEKLVRETGIGDSLVLMMNEKWLWATEPKNVAGESDFGVTNIRCHNSINDSLSISTISFTYCRSSYCLEFAHEIAFSETQGSYLKLYKDEDILIELGLYQKNDWGDLDFLGVKSLERGDWIQDIVELEQKIVAAKKKKSAKFEAEMARDRADKLPKASKE
jgi:hypothetical protein